MNEQVQETEATTELPPQEERDFVVAEDLETKTEDRPEWLPEKYKSGEDLAKAYKELESKLGTKDEDIRAEVLKEIEAESFKDRPDSAGEYQLPDYIDEESAIDSDVLKWWADHAFTYGFSQSEFEEGIAKVMQATQAEMIDTDAEIEKLGDNANARIEAASLFSKQFFSEQHMDSIERLTETAEGLETLEFIMEKLQSPSMGSDSTPSGKITEQGLREMMQDERYWHPARRNNDFIQEVNDGFQKLYNG
tara:strand:- start:1070 stop:1819 length:750 start_codon:yes stop_codon:yes gene_type:complete